MSKRCRECHHVNDDARLFCAACGASLDAHVRLIQGLERQRDILAEGKSTSSQRRDIKFYNTRKAPPKKEKPSPLPWILLCLAAAAIAVWFFLR